jgi:hypothetical protein
VSDDVFVAKNTEFHQYYYGSNHHTMVGTATGRIPLGCGREDFASEDSPVVRSPDYDSPAVRWDDRASPAARRSSSLHEGWPATRFDCVAERVAATDAGSPTHLAADWYRRERDRRRTRFDVVEYIRYPVCPPFSIEIDTFGRLRHLPVQDTGTRQVARDRGVPSTGRDGTCPADARKKRSCHTDRMDVYGAATRFSRSGRIG